jgi:hypothetical protein
MSRPADLREVPDLPEEIRQAALDGDLLLFVGARELMLAAFWAEISSIVIGITWS